MGHKIEDFFGWQLKMVYNGELMMASRHPTHPHRNKTTADSNSDSKGNNKERNKESITQG
jgi:hypothetical protein